MMPTKRKRLCHRGFPLHLPENVIIDILLQLPVKSLVRFRCVSQRWRSLIWDPQFAKSQFRQASTEHSQRFLISYRSIVRSLDCEAPFEEDSSPPRALVVPFKTRGRHVSIIGSCNGLVCVALYRHRDFYIWNPSTGIYRKLLDPGISLRGLLYWHGFGYDPITDDYKLLVANFRMPPSWEREGEVFSFKRNSWKKILRGLDDTGMAERSSGILCNGALHWHLTKCEPFMGEKIRAFDLAEEKFHDILMPSVRRYGLTYLENLCNLGERLCLIGNLSGSIEIWGMMEYGVVESWVLMHTIDYMWMDWPGRHLYWEEILPLYLSRNTPEFVAMMGKYLIRSGTDGKYLKRGGTVEYIQADFIDSFGYEAAVFVESLLSPYLSFFDTHP